VEQLGLPNCVAEIVDDPSPHLEVSPVLALDRDDAAGARSALHDRDKVQRVIYRLILPT
jgi:hypothetical protein